MWKAFAFAFNAVVPMLLLMCLGYMLKKQDVFDGTTLKKMNSFGFKICLSCMAFNNVYKVKNIQDIPVKFVLVVLLTLVVITVLGMVIAKFITKDNALRGDIVQNSFRSNYNVIGIPMAQELGGDIAASVSATLMAPTVLYYNIVSVIVLTFYGQGGAGNVNLKKLFLAVLKNPLIRALLLGLFCLVVRAFIPVGSDGTPVFSFAGDLPWIYNVIRDLGKIAPPLLLVLLGATINFSRIGAIKAILTISVAMRLILAPIMGFVGVFIASKTGFLAVDAPMLATLVGLFAAPATPVSAIMASELGCDGELAAQMVVWTTVSSMGTLLLIITFCKYMQIM